MSSASPATESQKSRSKTWALVLSIFGIAGLLAVGVVFSGLTTAARVAENARELHWANAMLGSSEVARLTVAQAVLVAGSVDEGPAEGGDRERAVAEAHLAVDVAQTWRRQSQAQPEVEASVDRLLDAAGETLSFIEQGDLVAADAVLQGELVDAAAALRTRLEGLQSDAAASVRNTETTADQLGVVLQFLVVLGLPAIALLWYRYRARREVKRSKSHLEAILDAERSRSRAQDVALADASARALTPLHRVLANTAALVSDETLAPSQRDALVTARRGALEVDRILTSFASAAALDAGLVDVEVDDFHLEDAIRAAVDAAAAEGIDVEAQPTKIWARGDQRAAIQILGAVISNAATHGGDHIQIGVGVLGDQVVVGVRDDGPGLPDDIRDRYFVAGSAAPGSVVSEGGGHGIPVSLALAVAMDGDLQYRRFDGWTSVELRLPVAFPSLIDPDHSVPVGRT